LDFDHIIRKSYNFNRNIPFDFNKDKVFHIKK
jgi:hypothetical protein